MTLIGNSTYVHIVGCTYLVDFGPSTRPRFHIVDKERRCSCQLNGQSLCHRPCPAVEAVVEYLRKGGRRAPDYMTRCPICGAQTFRDSKWDGRYTKEHGWRCSKGGIGHFLQAKAEKIQDNLRRKHAATGEHVSAAGR